MTTYSFEVAAINARPVTGKFGPTTAYDLMGADGVRYGFSFTNPAKFGISVGTVVSGNGTSDKFGVKLDLKTIVVGGAVSVTSATPPTPAKTATTSYGRAEKVFPLPNTHGDTAIIRQNALTNAVGTVADFIATQPTEKWPSLDEWTDMVITTAYKYAEFSSGQREVKAATRVARSGAVAADEIAAAIKAHSEDEEEAA